MNRVDHEATSFGMARMMKKKARIVICVVLLEAINDAGGVIETAKGAVVLAARL